VSYTRYTIEDGEGCAQDVVFEESEYVLAKDYARARGLRVIANEYESADSEMVDDFTPQANEDDDE
jgi:hypothetical protein